MVMSMLRRSSKQKKIREKIAEQSKKKLSERYKGIGIDRDLKNNLDLIKQQLGEAPDLIIRQFDIDTEPKVSGAVIFIDEMVSKDLVNQYILYPLMIEGEKDHPGGNAWEVVNEQLLSAGEVKEFSEFGEAIGAILRGDTVLLVNGYEKAMWIGSKSWPTRSISEPHSENVIRGSREGLSETIVFSLALIRRRLKDPDLRIKSYEIGEHTKTFVNLLYIENLTEESLVKEVDRRLKQIKIDGILESGYIEELIQDQIWTPFPQLQNTERPDSAVAHLLEGQVIILVDGTPHVLIAPAVFSQFYHSPEDYYERFWISTFLRLVRMVSFFLALLLPALYIAFVSFHPEMIPSRLAIAMAAGRSTVPFAAVLEAVVMELTVEVLREASIRLPSLIGPTIGIVGALVVGQAAVSAGLVSPSIVIIVGLTTICSYANPSYSAAISVRLIRFPFMIMASILGLYGIMLLFVLMIGHLVQLRSFGVPYMAPFAPFNWQDAKDTIIRTPWHFMEKRPVTFKPQDRRRKSKWDFRKKDQS